MRRKADLEGRRSIERASAWCACIASNRENDERDSTASNGDRRLVVRRPAPWARADDEDAPLAPLPGTLSVDSNSDGEAGGVSQAAFVTAPKVRPGAKRKPGPRPTAGRPAQADGRRGVAQADPLGFNEVRMDRATRPAGPPVRRASAESPAAPSAERPFVDRDVRPAQFNGPSSGFPVGGPPWADASPWVGGSAQSEPLGFSGARFQPSAPVDPSLGESLFEEPIEMADPYDPDAPVPALSSGDWLRNGRWYTQQSAVYMSRSTNVKNSIVLSTDFTSSNIGHYLNFLQIPLQLGFRPGIRSTVGRYLGRDARNRDHSVEFTYLGFSNWKASDGITAVTGGGIFSNIDPAASTSGATPVFNQSNAQAFAEASNFNSFELNYVLERRPLRDQMVYTRDSTWVRRATPSRMPALFGGLRVVTINERLNYTATSAEGNGLYNVFTHNNLVGPQGGFDWFYDHNDWRAGVRAKGAAMVNWNNQTTSVHIDDFNGAPLVPHRDQHASQNIFAFVGELNFIGSYRIRPNFSIRASYDLMWVTNLALAQNQVTFTPSSVPTISDGHALFYQGALLGFELSR